MTGNYEEGARIKLEYFDWWRSFRCGAFGDDAIIALRRCRLSGRVEDFWARSSTRAGAEAA